MLKEIHQLLANEAEHYLAGKGIHAKILPGNPARDEPSGAPRLFLAMQDYGIDPIFKDHLPETQEPAAGNQNYAHLISLYFIPYAADYLQELQLTEWLVEFFELRPFFQFSIGAKHYELAIAMQSQARSESYQFWIARQLPARLMVGYQVRVSAQ